VGSSYVGFAPDVLDAPGQGFSYTFQHLAANGNGWKASDIEQIESANAMID